MEIQLIAEIRESEKKAEEIVDSALASAEGRIKTAEDSFRSELEIFKKNFLSREREILNQAAFESEKCRESRVLEAELEIESFKKNAALEDDYIIGLIIKKITGST
jgi:vacuolar-type H+-ATPase subunit H